MPEKKIIALGSGMVAKPCVNYLLRDKKNVLTIACRTLSSTQSIAARRSSAKAVALDVASPELDHHVAEHDLVISLVPFVHHAAIVQWAIKGNTNFITTSYDSLAPVNISTSALELFGEPGGYSAMAKSAGLTCGIAIQLLLDDEPASNSNKPGVIAPYSREICNPIRVRAEAKRIKLVEHTL